MAKSENLDLPPEVIRACLQMSGKSMRARALGAGIRPPNLAAFLKGTPGAVGPGKIYKMMEALDIHGGVLNVFVVHDLHVGAELEPLRIFVRHFLPAGGYFCELRSEDAPENRRVSSPNAILTAIWGEGGARLLIHREINQAGREAEAISSATLPGFSPDPRSPAGQGVRIVAPEDFQFLKTANVAIESFDRHATASAAAASWTAVVHLAKSKGFSAEKVLRLIERLDPAEPK